jgi:hypothetical protein
VPAAPRISELPFVAFAREVLQHFRAGLDPNPEFLRAVVAQDQSPEVGGYGAIRADDLSRAPLSTGAYAISSVRRNPLEPTAKVNLTSQPRSRALPRGEARSRCAASMRSVAVNSLRIIETPGASCES